MPRYEIQAPDGRTIEIDGPRMPTAAQLQSIFARTSGGQTPARPTPARANQPDDPNRQPFSAEQFLPQREPQGSALGRFAGGAWEMVNPVTIASGLYGAVRHPIDTASNLIGAQVGQFEKAKEAYDDGRYSEMLGHAGAAALPLVGPIAADIGEQIGAGDVAGGLGRTTGLLAPLAARDAAVGARRLAKRVTPEKVATGLEAGAAERIADVMAPRANTNVGRRLGNKARAIAPELAKDAEITSRWSRSGLQRTITDKLDESAAALDEAQAAQLSARSFDTAPIVSDLKAKLKALTAESVDASKPTPKIVEHASTILDDTGRPIRVRTPQAEALGKNVVPTPLQPRARMLEQAIREIEGLGPVAQFDDLRLIRQAYDGPATTVYNPSTTADFLAKRGESLGAADVTSVLREQLAQMDPAIAQVNAQYSLYKNASDILKAAEEIERVRPKVGRQIMSRLTGALVGGQQGGTTGAIAGYALGPVVDQLAQAGYTTKLQAAGYMQRMATAIRTGDVGQAVSAQSSLAALVKKMAKTGAVTTAQASQAAKQ